MSGVDLISGIVVGARRKAGDIVTFTWIGLCALIVVLLLR